MGSLTNSEKFDNLYALNTYATLEVTYSQQTSNNRSLINFKLYIEVRNWSGYSGSQWIASSSASVSGSFNGGTISTPVKSYRVYGDSSGTGKALVSEGSFYHNHDSNGYGGTRNITVSVKPNIQAISSQPTLTMSIDIPLGNISVDSASTLSGVSSTIQSGGYSSVIVNNSNTSRAASYKHEISAYINGKLTTLGTKNGLGTFSFLVPSTIDSHIGGYSASGMIGVTTYVNGAYKDSNFYSTTFISGASLKPTVSNTGFSISEGNTKVKALSLNGYISDLSSIIVNLNDSAVSYKHGATKNMFNVYLYLENTLSQTLNTKGSSVTFPKVPISKTDKNGSIKVSVTDSRGALSDLIEIATFKVLGYESPSANGSVSRNLDNQSEVNVKVNYTMTPLTVGGQIKNPLSVSVQKKAGSGNWSTISSLSLSNLTSSGTLAKNDTGVSTASSFEYRVVLNDTLSSSTIIIGTIGTEKVPLDIFKTGIGVGKFHSEGTYDLEVGSGGIHSEGDIKGKKIIADSLSLNKGNFNLETTGNISGGVIETNKNGPSLNIRGLNHAYIQFFPGVLRKAYIGFSSSNSQNFNIRNEYTNKSLELSQDGKLKYNGVEIATKLDIPRVNNVEGVSSALLKSLNGTYIKVSGSYNADTVTQNDLVWFYGTGNTGIQGNGILFTFRITSAGMLFQLTFRTDNTGWTRFKASSNSAWTAWATI